MRNKTKFFNIFGVVIDLLTVLFEFGKSHKRTRDDED